GHGDVALSGVDQQLPLGLYIIRACVEPARDLWRSRAFDLNGPDVATRQTQDQVNFSASRGAIEEGLRASGCCGEQGLDAEPLPTAADDGMPEQTLGRPEPQEGMHDPAVPHIDLGVD